MKELIIDKKIAFDENDEVGEHPQDEVDEKGE